MSIRARYLAAGLGCLLVAAQAAATIVGLNQIVTPDLQTAGLLGLSCQVEHAALGNSQQLQAELGLSRWLEVAWFQGLTPGEGLFSTEVGLVQSGPHLLSVGALNWSTRGGEPQPMVEYGWYDDRNHLVGGAIHANREAEALLGYRRNLSEKWQIAVDYQSGKSNSTTIGFTYQITPELCVNPALYRTNGRPHHLLGYVVATWNLTLWK